MEKADDMRRFTTVFLLVLFFFALGVILGKREHKAELTVCVTAYTDCAEKYNAMVYKVEGYNYDKLITIKNFSIDGGLT